MRLPHLALALLATCAPAAAQLVQVTLDATSPGRTTKVAFAPGVVDQYYVANKDGRVWIIRGGNYVPQPFLDIRARVNDMGEGGLLGLAFDPDFGTSDAFFVSYTTGTGQGDNVVARFTATSPDAADPTSEAILWGPHGSTQARHKGGDLEFAPDGTLLFAIGDGGATPAFAQDLTSPFGKVHRLDPALPHPHVPADNPFVGVTGAVESTWAVGFRNPWRIDVDAVTGDVYVGDVGAGGFEEITRIAWSSAGANAGWPCQEGPSCTGAAAPCSCPDPAFVEPLAWLDHSDGTGVCSIIGGVVVRGGPIAGLDGQYLFADFCSGRVFRVEDPGGSAAVVEITAEIQAPGGGPVRPVEIAQSPNGDVYLAEHYGGAIYRLEPRPGFERYCSSARNSTGLLATLDVSGSTSIAAGDLTLNVDSLPPFAFGYFLLSAGRDEVLAFGGSAATLCLASPIVRWSALITNSGATGDVTLHTDLSNLPPAVQVAPGSTWHFQYWTRDANPTPTSATSDAVAVTFAP